MLAGAAAAAGPETGPARDTSRAALMGPLSLPTSAEYVIGSLYNGMELYADLVSLYMASDTAAAAVGRSSRSSVKVTLPVADVAKPVPQAYLTATFALRAAAHYARQLEEAAGIGISQQAAGVGSAAERSTEATNMRIWQQVLSSEQGRQLPQALMDVGSLMCAALPSRSCCNEPSCCCLDKPSELQLAGGKGTKCSGCGVARYCSEAHQKLHWKQHKPACRAIAAAAKSASGAPEPAAGLSKG
jgi:hypothetical protein